MGVYRRGKTFWCSFLHDGRRIQRPTGKHTKPDAEAEYIRIRSRYMSGEVNRDAPAEVRTLKALRDKYMAEYAVPYKAPSTVTKDSFSFKRLIEFFGDCEFGEITPRAISAYKESRRRAGAATATLARELELLRASLNHAIKAWEWLEVNPFWKTRIEQPRRHRDRWITPEEESRLLTELPEWAKDVVVFALNTGMRKGEILALKWGDVDLRRKTALVSESKNGEQRTIPLNQTVSSLLTDRVEFNESSDFVFPSEAGSQLNGRNMTRAFNTARARAGLDDVRFHDLRHTFATRLVQAGLELYVVKELLGHKSLKMTMRYAHHNPESLRRGVEILDRAGSSATVCYT